MITIDDFSKVDIRVGKFVSVEPVEGSEKLLKEIVDFGPEIGERQILSGIQKYYKPEDLVGKLGVFVINLEPRMMMGLESQGMLLAVDGNDPASADGDQGRKPILLTTAEEIEPGAKAH